MPQGETIQKGPADSKLSVSARTIESLLLQQIARDHDPLDLRRAFVDLRQLGVVISFLTGYPFLKRRLARSPWARMIVGSVSRPARTSAGGGTICSVVKMIACLAMGPTPPPAIIRYKSAAAKARWVGQTARA